MSFSIKCKELYSKIFYNTGVNKVVIKKLYNNYMVILMYHRILKKEESGRIIQSGMYVEPENFKNQVIYIKRNFNNISISEIPSINKKNIKTSARDLRPYCILTFDDGWSDFFYNAYPIIKEHDIKATVFLTTNYIGSKNLFWTDQLSYLIKGRNNKRKLAPTDHPIIKYIESMRENYENIIENAINLLKNLKKEEIQNVIGKLGDRWELCPVPPQNEFLTWDEVREMGTKGNIVFGSHTENHHILTRLSRGDVKKELQNSKDKLLQLGVVDPTFIPFSYPNGDYNDMIVDLVKETGYSLAVTTQNGWNKTDNDIDLFRMKRIGIHQDMTSTVSMFSSRILKII